MKRTSMAIVALLVLLSSTISFLASAHAPVMDADISVSPAVTTVTVSSVFTVDIIVTDVVALFGWQFSIHFDPTAVEVIDVTEGPFLMSGGATIFATVIDNIAGNVKAGSILIVPSPGVDGSGILAHVTFHCKGPTDTDLHFDEDDTFFFDPAGEVIPTDKFDGYVQQLPDGFVIPEVPLGTIMASAAMIIALVAYVTMPKWRRKPI